MDLILQACVAHCEERALGALYANMDLANLLTAITQHSATGSLSQAHDCATSTQCPEIENRVACAARATLLDCVAYTIRVSVKSHLDENAPARQVFTTS